MKLKNYKKIKQEQYMENKEKLIQLQKNKIKKVLILSCGTGGGHNSAAKAIQEALTSKGIQADFIEYLEIIGEDIKNKVNDLYIKSTHGSGQAFKEAYKLGTLYQKTKLKSPIYQLNSLSKNKLLNYIIENEYNYIVTTHLFAGQALTAIKKEYDIHFIEVATDYVCIPFWEETNPDYFIIPDVSLKQDFIDKGVSSKKLIPLGIPVSLKYSKKYDCNHIRKELNLKENERYILIMSGSMGFGNLEDMIKKLLEEFTDINFIVCCGNNKKMQEKIEKIKSNRITILGFSKELEKYMAISEVVLTKPGGLTTTEIATIRRPFIHTMPIPGCENYNADFFSTRKMSLQSKNEEEIINNLKILLNDKIMQNELMKNQEKYINQNSCNNLADLVIEKMNAIME